MQFTENGRQFKRAARPLFILTLFVAIIFSACQTDGNKKGTVVNTGDTALEQLNALVAKDATDHKLLYERAKYLYDQDKYDPVIRDMKKAIELDSMVPEYYHLLSNAYMDYYRSREALNTMIEAGDRFPKRIPTLLKLSETQLILKQNEESLFTVARILTLEPDHPEGHFMKGMNFRAIGEKDRAIGAFQTVTELDPKIIDAWLLVGDLYEEKGEPIAKEFYETATTIAPDDPNVWHALAYYLQNHDDDDGAIKIYRKINAIDKNYTDAYLNAGIVLLTNKRLDEAKEQFDILARMKPQNQYAYYYRGLIYEEQGNIDAARAELQNAINLAPEFSDAKKAMANLSK